MLLILSTYMYYVDCDMVRVTHFKNWFVFIHILVKLNRNKLMFDPVDGLIGRIYQ